MRYTIIDKKMYRINDDGTLTEKQGIDLKGNLVNQLRGHVEKEVKDDKTKKDKDKKDKEDKDKKDKEDKDDKIKNKVVIESITPPQKKKGRPKKEKA
jgi:hypothetical protein